jgi:hypothetical protein
LRYSSASDEDAFLIVERTAECHVDDVLQRLERLAAMTNEQLGLFAREVQTRDRQVFPRH